MANFLFYVVFTVIFCALVKCYTVVTKGKCKSKRRLDGKTVIITGANAGIGKETAKDLSRRGARVILACRSKERGEAACDEITRETGNTNVVTKICDLSSLASIRQFAKNINETEERVDVLVLNAGLIPPSGRHLTVDGLEIQFGTNHLGHFLLTNLLLDIMKRSAPARIVVVSSVLHFFGSIDFDNLNLEKSVPEPFFTYSKSKLANVLMVKELSRRLAGSEITVNALHPGMIDTDINRDRPWIVQFFLQPPISDLYSKTTEEGAQTTIYLSVSEEVEKVTGKYFADCKLAWSLPKADDKDLAARLWKVSAKLTGLIEETNLTN